MNFAAARWASIFVSCRSKSSAVATVGAIVALALLAAPAIAQRLPRSRVILNGVPTAVYYNDGDTFRILDGRYRNGRARLNGFNTLESFGPVHTWGGWHPFELFVLAKKATKHARSGTWHCQFDGERDGYGRMLVFCPDLATSQIRHGYAHAVEVEDRPSRPELLRAQDEAIRQRRGMWAKGVPAFVLTSVHSADEDPTRESHYNRLVSTRDGHSEEWTHNDTYRECAWVCSTEDVLDVAKVRAVARSLRDDLTLASHLTPVSNLLLTEIVSRYARQGVVPPWVPENVASLLRPALEGARAAGAFGELRRERGACMLYAAMPRRYGEDRATCMRGRGTTP